MQCTQALNACNPHQQLSVQELGSFEMFQGVLVFSTVLCIGQQIE